MRRLRKLGPVLFIGLGFWQTLGCKLQKREKTNASKHEACLARGSGYVWTGVSCVLPEPGFIHSEACQAIRGAQWNLEAYRCDLPASVSDCQKAGPELLWAGDGCVAKTAPKNFYQLCMDRQASEGVKFSIAVLSRPYKGTANIVDCLTTYVHLKKKTSMRFQNEGLVDLTPLQGFQNLEKLDLWNNNIVDLKPLAHLTKLKELKLGHNRIESLEPLTKLSKLQKLYISENRLTSVASLKGLGDLRFVDVSYNQIQDLSSLDANRYTLGFFAEGNEAP